MSTGTQFDLFFQSVLALARSVVIKHSGTVTMMNKAVEERGLAVLADPLTWRYYMHLAGEYHPADKMMTITSLDTLQTINFTRENLLNNRGTLRAYRSEEGYRRILEGRYPEQVTLIAGILNPVDKQTAVNAIDGTILFHDSRYVERNENLFLNEFQQRIYGLFNRWYNPNYEIIDELYVPAFLSAMYAQLPALIITSRMQALRTPFVHSYFVREYLASNGRLDVFEPFMDLYQKLYLYRNLQRLENSVGRSSNFEELLNVFFTHRNLPVTGYHIEHDTTDQVDDVVPKIVMIPDPLNTLIAESDLDETNVHTILSKSADQALRNAEVLEEAVPLIEERAQLSASNRLLTKVVETNTIDRSNSSIRLFIDVLINEWTYRAANDLYVSFISVNNPKTDTPIQISVKDALIIAIYAFQQTYDTGPFTTIPRIHAYKVLRTPAPTYEDLLMHTDTSIVDVRDIQNFVDNSVSMNSYSSTEFFYLDCKAAHDEYLRMWRVYANEEHHVARGMLENIVNRYYMNILCELTDTVQTFDDWFASKNIDLTNLNTDDFQTLLFECIEKATGMNLFPQRSLANIQEAMVGVMKRLTSYDVQYIRTINEGDIFYVSPPSFRIGDFDLSVESDSLASVGGFTVHSLKSSKDKRLVLSPDDIAPSVNIETSITGTIQHDLSQSMQTKMETLGTFNVRSSGLEVLNYSFVLLEDPPPNDGNLNQYGDPGIAPGFGS